MDIHQLVASKTDDKKLEKFFHELQKFDKKKDYSKLSKNQIELGLIFLNGIPELRLTENDPNHYYTEYIAQDSKKYQRIVALCGGETSKNNIWDENNALWTYFFGEDKAKFIKDVMQLYPKMPFQQSLRAPNIKNTHFINQINGIISLLGEFRYDFTLAEYAIYSNYLHLYNSNITYLWAAAINKKDKNIFPIILDIILGKHETGTVSQPIIKAMLLSDNEEAWGAVEKLLLAAQRQEGLRQVVLDSLSQVSVGAMKHFIKLILKEKLTRFSSVIRALNSWANLGWEAEKESTIIRFLELSDKFLNEVSEEKPLLVDSKLFLDAVANANTSKDNSEIYMALWAQGVYDVEKTYPLLDYLTDNQDNKNNTQANNQILALYFVQQINFPEISIKYGLKLLKSNNLEILAFVLPLLMNQNLTPANYFSLFKNNKAEIFDILKEKLKVLPAKPKTFEGLIFPWHKAEVSKDNAFGVMLHLTDFTEEKEIDKILPFFGEMNTSQRQHIVYFILLNNYKYEADGRVVQPPLTQKQRAFAFSIIKDKADYVRTAAINAFKNEEIEENELPIFEDILSRKSAGMRKTVIDIFLRLKPPLLQISIERLLKSAAEQRLAGLDLLTQAKIAKLLPLEWINKTALKFSENPKITAQEKIMVDVLVSNSATLDYNAENGFGLYNPQNITPAQNPTFPTTGEYAEKTKNNPAGLSVSLENINNAFEELKKLYLENKNFEYTIDHWDNSVQTVLLGNNFATLKINTTDFTNEQNFENYPLAKIWRKWFDDAKFTDLDWYLIALGRNIAPMILPENQQEIPTEKEEKSGKKNSKTSHGGKKLASDNQGENQDAFIAFFQKTFQKVNDKTIQATIPTVGEGWNNPIDQIMVIFMYLVDYPKKLEFLEGLLKTLYASVDKDEVSKLFVQKDQWENEYYQTWRDGAIFTQILSNYNYLSQSSDTSDAQFTEFWQLEKWVNQTMPEYPNKPLYFAAMQHSARAFSLNLITKDELFARIMQPDFITSITTKPIKKDVFYGYEYQKPILEQFPYLNDYKDIVRDRILEIELKRGDTATPVTHLATSLQSLFGISVFVDILIGLGKDTLNRGYIYYWGGQTSKKEVLSTLLKRCETLPNETQTDFNEKIKAAKITEKRLVEAATYAPQWLKYVAENLGWKDMQKAVWWLHAHTNSYHSAETETEIAKYSKVEIADFKEGAVDREWFKEAYESLGEERWKLLYDAAKYISDGNGHIRAKLYADVILGNITLEDITKKITEKRNQDYLRVFGLFALSAKNQEKEVLSRYQFLQKFKKESKAFGAQKQASEALAVRIAMDNLARTAGFPDPMRLTWAMETQEAIDIIDRAKALNFNEVTISLIIDEDGKASLECFKADKQLKNIPDSLKKEPAVIELKEFNKTLNDQYKRTRKSLEEAMVNGDVFMLSEISNLMNHPVVSPMLRKLVLKTEKTTPNPSLKGGEQKTPLLPKEGQGVVKTGFSLGFWKENNLVAATGEVFEPNASIQIAHCVDLYEDKHWSDYQKYCFENQIKQPFKQIFRELYIPTGDELKEKTISRRYAGHQVQTFKTVALLKGQGWTVDYDEGLQKVFHKEHYIAKMYAMADWFTPSEIESPTLETIEFIDQKTGKLVVFEDMNKRIFSEVMRDIDLVVSVAHVGEVDVEASQSSVELRVALVRETMRLFKITNVTLKDAHALIKGTRGDYSVHLGSGVAHKVASSALFILPVHSQQRGKMFLPFLDEDPKTAEIMSKILLLSKDNEIQDPTILSQLL